MEGQAEGEAVGTGPGPPVLTPQSIVTAAAAQDPSCCSNCYRPVSLENFGKKFSDLLCSQVKSGRARPKSEADGPRNRNPGKKEGLAVTVLEALDIVFNVKRGSYFSQVLLDELNYVLCLKCTCVLAQLYKLLTEFTDYSQPPSFLRSVFVQNVAWRTAAGQPDWIPLPRNDLISYCKAAEADRLADDSGLPPDLEPEYENQFMENPEDALNPDLDHSDGEPEVPDYTNSYGRSIKRPLIEEKVVPSGTKQGPKTRTRIPLKNRPEGQIYRAAVVGKGGKNYECPICFQRFLQNNHVLRHLPNHQVKNHFCTFCNSGFGTKRALCKHVVSAHRGQVRTNTSPPATVKSESDINSKVPTSPSSEGSGKVNTIPVSEKSGKVNTIPVSEKSGKVNTSPVSEGSGKVNTTPVSEGSGKVNTTPVSEGSGKVNTTPVSEKSGKVNTIPVSEKSGKVNTSLSSEVGEMVKTSPLSEGSGKLNTSPSSVVSVKVKMCPSSEGSGKANTRRPSVVSGKVNTSPSSVVSGKANTSASSVGSGKANTSPSSVVSGKANTSPSLVVSGKANTIPSSAGSGKVNTNPSSVASGKANTSPSSVVSGKANTSPSSVVSGKANTSPSSVVSGKANTSLSLVVSGKANTSQSSVGSGKVNTIPSSEGSGKVNTIPSSEGSVKVTSLSAEGSGKVNTSASSVASGKVNTSASSVASGKVNTSPSSVVSGKANTSPSSGSVKMKTSLTAEGSRKVNNSRSLEESGNVNTSSSSEESVKVNTSPSSVASGNVNTSPSSVESGKVNTSPSSVASGKVNTSPSAVINKKVSANPQPAMAMSMSTRRSGTRNLRHSSKPYSYTNAEKLKARRIELMDPEPPPKPPLSLKQGPKDKGRSSQGSHPARQKAVVIHSGPSSKSKLNRKQERKENRKDSVPGLKPPKTDPASSPAPRPSRQYNCPECHAKFLRLDHVTRHLKVHSISNFRCSVCRAGFRNAAKLRSHVWAVHNLDPALLESQGPPVTNEPNPAEPLANDLQEPEGDALELMDFQNLVDATILECDNFVVD